jgi:hypothetical protein
MNAEKNPLLCPVTLYSRAEVLSRPCPVPKEPGAYAWFFRQIPPGVPVDGCVINGDLTLLYIGISPKAAPKNGAPASRQTLRSRLRYHMNGNAEGSTLRLSLGCLLGKRLGIQLRRVGSGKRMTFSDGEQKFNAWLDESAFVAWVVHPQPWLLEEELIASLSLPLNLDGNSKHPFASVLAAKRARAKDVARMLPVEGR